MRRWISCVRPDKRPARSLAVVALRGGAREHRVLGGDPAAALPPQPSGNAFLDRRGAQHARAAELHQHRAGGELGEVAREGDRPELVGLAAVATNSHQTLRHQMPTTRFGVAMVTGPPNASAPSLAVSAWIVHRPEVREDETLRAGLARGFAGLLRRQVDRRRAVGVQIRGLRQHDVGARIERSDRPAGAGVGGVDQAPAVAARLHRVGGWRMIGARELQRDVADLLGVAVADRAPVEHVAEVAHE